MTRTLLFVATHALVFGAGFALGVYVLPILTAPPSVDRAMLAETAKAAQYKAAFKRDLKGSDAFHWGEGQVGVSAARVANSVYRSVLAVAPKRFWDDGGVKRRRRLAQEGLNRVERAAQKQDYDWRWLISN